MSVGLAGAVCLLSLAGDAAAAEGPVRFVDVTAQAGLDHVNVSGEADHKSYIFEAKGGGVAALDYDNDGWMDLVFAQGSTLERVRDGQSPTPVLYRNLGNGSFEHVTRRAGLGPRGWGMGVAAADYDNDGWTDLYFTYLGPDALFRNNGDGTFSDVTVEAGIDAPGWSASAAFADFDNDGFLDIYVTGYLDVGPNSLPQVGGSSTCPYLGVEVMCGPAGLPGAADHYFHNDGRGHFEERSASSGAEDRDRYPGLGVVASDLDADGDMDIFVGNDATPNLLFVNLGGGRFEERGLLSGLAYSGDGIAQASMGLDSADYDNDGLLDLYSTHFAHDYSTLYRNVGELSFVDVSAMARVREAEGPLVSWGTRFVDIDLDGYKDIVHVNGHVYPHLRGASSGEAYEQPALSVYVNRHDGTFRDASEQVGTDASKPIVGRGSAFADFDNDGDVDVAIACLNAKPLLLRSDQSTDHHWLMLRLVGRDGNRDAIGARIRVRAGATTQYWEVKRSLGIYSSSDPRAHFGVGMATVIDELRVAWPGGGVTELRDLKTDMHYLLDEKAGLQPERFGKRPSPIASAGEASTPP